MARIPTDIKTHLAWQFEAVLSGNFRRDKIDYADIDFPILVPLPDRKSKTVPREGATAIGPFIYFVVDGELHVRYVGKSKEKTVVKRWVRPGVGGPTTHYWTHTNKSAGCVRRIAQGIQAGHGPFQLRFVSTREIPTDYLTRFALQFARVDPLKQVENGFMSLLHPDWNDPNR